MTESQSSLHTSASFADHPHWCPPRDATRVLQNRYTVGKRIGSGRFSSVFEAVDQKTDQRKVALKVFRTGGSFFEAYEHEKCMVDHFGPSPPPSLLRCLDHFVIEDESDGAAFGCLVYEYFPMTLADVISGIGTPYMAQAVQGMLCIAEALEFLHARDMVHTDIKPENVLVQLNEEQTGFVRVCLADYSSIMKMENNKETGKLELLDNYHTGTMQYNAPEIVFGVPYGPAVDIWSLGCLGVEVLTGETLFEPCIMYDSDSEEEEEPEDGEGARPSAPSRPRASTVSSKSSSSDEGTHSSYSSSYDEDTAERAYDWLMHYTLLHLWKAALGRIPRSYRFEGHRSSWFYTSSGKMEYRMAYLPEEAEKPLAMLSDAERKFVEEVFWPCLHYNPEERPAATVLTARLRGLQTGGGGSTTTGQSSSSAAGAGAGSGGGISTCMATK